MARKSGNKAPTNPNTWEDMEHDEVDTFHEQQDNILLEKANGGRKSVSYDAYSSDDDEVLALSGQESSEDEEDQEEEDQEHEESDDQDDEEIFGKKKKAEEEDDDEEGWGSAKGNYYGADDAEDDEDAKREEQEALRIQKKQLEDMDEDAFVDDEDFDVWNKETKEKENSGLNKSINDLLPQQDLTKLSSSEKLTVLEQSYPEILPLAEELSDLTDKLADFDSSEESEELLKVQRVALLTYIATINAYFALFITKVQEGKVNLKDHPVMEGILKAREAWRLASNLKGEDNMYGDLSAKEGEEEDEIEDLNVSDIESDIEDIIDSNKRKTADSDDEYADMPAKSINNGDDDFNIDLPTVTRPAKKTKISSKKSDFGESSSIDDIDAEEKSARKKSLRFYTSKIDQQALKNKNKYTGDVDLPYKERRFERQQRLAEEARKRGLTEGADLDDNDYNSEEEKTAGSIKKSFDKSYYDTIQNGAKEKKANRMASHDMAVQAAKEGKLKEVQELAGEDGKRAVNYQILKNKGLTPHRNKDNRNSRVKKRKKYEAAKKKLTSIRQVYKAPTSTYAGEKTGIKKNLSRSVRFSG
ncbi:hypothetical protein NADFUDRAFT_82305 [Nadsonia fulvescens var. elongata DSM 6958]|uniref:Sas10 C-terminal domain-containing protein n=1 Tax=Nadsonia fulvescens var. elongata DSM 6958 TaxID=857566 RepID=A0A1E3PMI5_9ASCO|nr:hypothetical protein NADFUDRAFT_82305 [Nadsonia fulvescens var. elongata DSM 6958]